MIPAAAAASQRQRGPEVLRVLRPTWGVQTAATRGKVELHEKPEAPNKQKQTEAAVVAAAAAGRRGAPWGPEQQPPPLYPTIYRSSKRLKFERFLESEGPIGNFDS